MTKEEIIEKYLDVVYQLALARTNQPSDAEDVCQEVFLKYIDKTPTFRDEEHAKAWFIKVTINMSKNYYRSPEYAHRADMEDDTLEATVSDEDFIAELENRTMYEERISRLNPRYRMALLLHFDCGYTIRESAALLGETEDAVKALLTRGKRQYRNMVMKRDTEDSKNRVTAGNAILSFLYVNPSPMYHLDDPEELVIDRLVYAVTNTNENLTCRVMEHSSQVAAVKNGKVLYTIAFKKHLDWFDGGFYDSTIYDSNGQQRTYEEVRRWDYDKLILVNFKCDVTEWPKDDTYTTTDDTYTTTYYYFYNPKYYSLEQCKQDIADAQATVDSLYIK